MTLPDQRSKRRFETRIKLYTYKKSKAKSESMLFLLLLLSVTGHSLCKMNFTGHKLLALIPSNEKELEFMRNLSDDANVDAWNFPKAVNDKMNIRVSPEAAGRVQNYLKLNGIHFNVITDNIQKWIDEEREENPPDDALAGRQEDFQLDVYHTLEAIYSHLDSVAERYNNLANVLKIGTTYENNPIKLLKVGSPGDNKPAFWIDCGIHAREWVAPATCLYIIEQLVKGYDTDSDIQQLLEFYDWYILPVANPDGYKYTWSINRMWRKNRAPSYTRNPFCRGTDPNRNFDAAFGGASTSNNPCSEIYRGPTAFSEAESKAIRDSILVLGSSLKAYITIHAYSQLWMTPNGYTRDNPPDYEDHMKVLTAAVSALESVHGEKYKYGPIASTIYPAAGSSTDWAYIEGKVKYSFAAELRDTGRYGFILPRNQIIPTAEENFAAIKVIANFVKDETNEIGL